MGFELFVILVMTVMGLGVMYGASKFVLRSKGMIKKWKENKREAKEIKFKKLKVKLES